jgi:hypothetical protein
VTAALGLAARPLHAGSRLALGAREWLLGRARLLALGGLVISVAGVGWGLFLWAGERFAPPPVSFVSSPLPIAAHIPMIVAYALVGTIIAARQPRNAIGWLFLAIGILSSFVPAIDFLVAGAGDQFSAPSGATVFLAWLASNFHLPLAGSMVIAVFLIFPDGRPMAGRWSRAGWVAVLGALLIGFGQALDPTGLRWYPTMPNPTSLPASAGAVAVAVQAIGLLLVMGSLGVGVWAMVLRYRHYTPDERRGIFWVALTVIQLAVAGGALLVVRYGIVVPKSAGEAILVVTLVAATLVPLAAVDGMLRYRLFNIELVLAHALVYVPLSAFLAGLYAASVALFQRIFASVSGDTSDITIVLTTLVLAGTFTPVRKWLEGVVDRHFKPATPATPVPRRVRAAPPAPAGADAIAATTLTSPTAPPTPSMANQDLDAVAELRELQARLARLEGLLAGRV